VLACLSAVSKPSTCCAVESHIGLEAKAAVSKPSQLVSKFSQLKVRLRDHFRGQPVDVVLLFDVVVVVVGVGIVVVVIVLLLLMLLFLTPP
jgi:hypothetical protein